MDWLSQNWDSVLAIINAIGLLIVGKKKAVR